MSMPKSSLGQAVTLETILQFFIAEIREGVPEATQRTCVLTDDPNAVLHTGQSSWWNVSPSPQGQVDMSALAGGGPAQMTVRSRVIVTAFVRSVADRPNFIDVKFPLLDRKRRQLWRLLMNKNWESLDGFYVLNEPVLPAEWSWSITKGTGSVQCAFDIEWDEDISDEESP